MLFFKSQMSSCFSPQGLCMYVTLEWPKITEQNTPAHTDLPPPSGTNAVREQTHKKELKQTTPIHIDLAKGAITSIDSGCLLCQAKQCKKLINY